MAQNPLATKFNTPKKYTMHQSSLSSFDFTPICTNTAPVKAGRIKSMVQDYTITA